MPNICSLVITTYIWHKDTKHHELKHYLIAITLCAPYLLSLLGCKNHQDANERDLLTIHIKDYENKTIPRPAVISNIDTIELDTHGYFMSDIKTVCISDTMAYVADRANTVWAFKYPSGDFVRRIRNVGHGNGEYASVGLWLWATASCT